MAVIALFYNSLIRVPIFSVRASYDDFFPGKNPNEEYMTSNMRFELAQDSTYLIHDSFFFQMSHNNSGGIIFCDNLTNVSVVVEDCVFCQCSISGGMGGAIFFDCPSGDFVLNKVCAGYCYTRRGGSFQFAYITCGNENINYAAYLSIYKCSPEAQSRYHCIGFCNGNQTMKSLNVTSCIVHLFSATYHWNPSALLFDYSTIHNTFAEGFVCLYFAGGDENNMSHSNIVNNSQNYIYEYGVIYNWGEATTTIYKCVFFGNAIFGNQILFSNPSGELIVFDCDIDQQITTLANVTFAETKTYSSTSSLTHYLNNSCLIHPSTWFPTPAQTMPPSPTECMIPTCNISPRRIKVEYIALFTLLINQ